MSMFWGAVVKPGKPYEEELEGTDDIDIGKRITGAALGPGAGTGGASVLMLEVLNGDKFVLATLEAPHCRQVSLDVHINEVSMVMHGGVSGALCRGVGAGA
jgi:hypothetical protein